MDEKEGLPAETGMPCQGERELARAVINGEDLWALTKLVSKETGRSVLVTGRDGRVLSHHFCEGQDLPVEYRLDIPLTERNEPFEAGVLFANQKLTCSLWPLGMRFNEGCLVLPGPLADFPLSLQAYLTRAAWAFLVVLNREQKNRSVENRLRNEFVQDVIYNNIETAEQMIARGSAWGLDMSKPHAILVVTPNKTEQDPERFQWARLVMKVEELLGETGKPFALGERGRQLVILIAPYSSDRRWKREIKGIAHDLLTGLGNNGAFLGVGKLYQDVTQLYRAFQEAKIALELGKIFFAPGEPYFYDDLGVFRFCYNEAAQELDDFTDEVLGPLLRYDLKHDGELFQTLEAYFKSNEDIQKTAEILFVHQNTLRYRLKKIEEILEVNLGDFQVKFNLFAALKVALMRK